MEMEIYLTNLGMYNEGTLHGEWFKLPMDIEESLEKIGIGSKNSYGGVYEEYFITDYIAPFKIGEYDSLEKLNDIAEELERYESLEQAYNEVVFEVDSLQIWHRFDDNEVIEMLLSGKDYSGAISSVLASDNFNWNDDYITLDSLGHLETLSKKGFDKFLDNNSKGILEGILSQSGLDLD